MLSCTKPAMPKEYGYFRIRVPEHRYQPASLPGYPYRFDLSTSAQITPIDAPGEQYWLSLRYPEMKATVHCSYKPVRGNLRELSREAQDFVYAHTMKATSIPEKEYNNPEQHVYGLFYELKGNTATPIQFYLTDSVHHFFRGAMYYDCIPNQDSLAPVTDWLKEDIQVLIESFQWN